MGWYYLSITVWTLMWFFSFHIEYFCYNLSLYGLIWIKMNAVFCFPEFEHPGPWFNIKMTSCQYRKFHVEIRRSYDRLISTMGFPILVRRHLYIESGPGENINTFSLLPFIHFISFVNTRRCNMFLVVKIYTLIYVTHILFSVSSCNCT